MLAHPGSNGWLQVVAIVGDTPNEGLAKPTSPAVYLPYTLVLGDSFNLAVRTKGNPMSLARAIRAAVHDADAGQPVNEIQTAGDILADDGWAQERFVASLFTMFSGLALVLAAIGLYSVMSVIVSQRHRELGIRMALGATRRSVLMLVLFAGSRAVVAGLALGIGVCLLTSGLFQHWTQASLYDPFVMVTVSCVFLLASLAASFGPAWKACRVGAIGALR
jgi:ABC-type antimicrobial peptide transport system permease subunit